MFEKLTDGIWIPKDRIKDLFCSNENKLKYNTSYFVYGSVQ